MRLGFRILPITIFVAAIMLTVKVGSIWQAVSEGKPLAGAPVEAQRALAQNESRPPSVDSGASGFDTFNDELPEGSVAAETTEEDDRLADLTSLSPGEIRLLYDLSNRRDDIAIKEREISEREALLRAAEEQLLVKQQQLERIREEIRGLVQEYDQEQDADQERLRNIYSAMKPKSAAAIFNELELETLVGVLRGMSARKVAPIIAAMTPDRARILTRELAERTDLPQLPN